MWKFLTTMMITWSDSSQWFQWLKRQWQRWPWWPLTWKSWKSLQSDLCSVDFVPWGGGANVEAQKRISTLYDSYQVATKNVKSFHLSSNFLSYTHHHHFHNIVIILIIHRPWTNRQTDIETCSTCQSQKYHHLSTRLTTLDRQISARISEP